MENAHQTGKTVQISGLDLGSDLTVGNIGGLLAKMDVNLVC